MAKINVKRGEKFRWHVETRQTQMQFPQMDPTILTNESVRIFRLSLVFHKFH